MADAEHTNEIWRIIDVAPSYAVSNHGRIRRVAGGQGARPLIRKQDLERTGYFRVRVSENGAPLRLSVHRLVAIAFLGSPPTAGHQVAHFDNDKTNNHASNLRWATSLENIRDKQRHGTQARGERSGRAKLTEKAAIEIRNSPAPAKQLAALYAVCTQTIRRVRNGEGWKHI